jgi:uncharacterized protein (DUF305 family)
MTTLMRSTFVRRTLAVLMLVPAIIAMPVSAQHEHHGDAGSEWGCDTVGTPAPASHEQHMMEPDATPDAAAIDVDVLYIDMMIPHHESIIALAQAALPNLTDPRLVTIAESIVTAQTAENEQMAAWRDAWYGSPDPDTSEGQMALMLEAMPVGTMDEMMREMDPQWQVASFCASADPDVAFAEQAIRHHQMAVDASEAVAGRLVHPELAEFAAGVIEVQQAEIDELIVILDDLGT